MRKTGRGRGRRKDRSGGGDTCSGRGRSGGRDRGGSRDGARFAGKAGCVEQVSLWATVGTQVEVRSDEEGFIGAWYAAEVVHLESSSACVVEYEQLLSDKGFPLQELVLLPNLRPRPPALAPRSSWLPGHLVEAYDRDGWWAGNVVRSLPEENRVLVHFRTTGEQLTFAPSLLRGLQNWDNGIWTDLTQVGRPDENNHAVIADIVDSFNRPSDTDLNGSTSPPNHTETQKPCHPRKSNLSCLELPYMPPEEMVQTRESESCDEDPEPFAGPSIDAFQSHEREDHRELQAVEEPQTPLNATDCFPSAFKASKRLELIAYQLLVKALRLKGPLDWNQEVLLANVRLQLNITTAEQKFVLEGLMPSED